jgi:ABC-type Na+ efflux pump permease subunit
MHTVLTLAGREFTRLRSRFTGRARIIVTVVLVVALTMSYVAYRQQAIRGRSLYRVGVSPDGPVIRDTRFNVQTLSPQRGEEMLARGAIDVYIHDGEVMHRDTEKARYATGALALYLESLELARISELYPEAEAFPLRVDISNFLVETSPDGTEVKERIVPSLTQTTVPFADVLKSSLHLFPLFLVSVFFTSGLMEERRDRRISVLLSSPPSPLQIIIGKTLPYLGFALVAEVLMTLALGGNVVLGLVVFLPVVLFVLSIYLMVPLVYRTFKDTTFISMFVTVATTLYLLFPAMLLGVSDLSYISPLALAVEMYRGNAISWRAYLTSALPMFLIFGVFIYVGSRILNEEYLTRYRPLYRKLAEAVLMAMNRRRPYLSVFLVSLSLIPVVYLVQLVILTVSLNLPTQLAFGGLLIMSVLVEEVVKSVGVVMLIESRSVRKPGVIVLLTFLSALGFLVGEKLLLLVSIQSVSRTLLSAVLLNAGKLWITLLAHFAFTTIVTLLTRWLGPKRYHLALLAGGIVHLLYNLSILGVLQ